MKKVIVECDPDEILVQILGLGRKEIAHQPNKGEVCNFQLKTGIGIAIIDEDPGSGQPNYLKGFKLVEHKFGIKKLVNDKGDRVILIICPRLEEWVVDQCKKSGLNPESFFLPAEPKRLKDTINLRLQHFRRLLLELIKQKNEGLLYLQSIIMK